MTALKAEQWVKPVKKASNHEVPQVTLEAFIIYFPHWLRLSEIHGMATYSDPWKFVEFCCEQYFHVDMGKASLSNLQKTRSAF
jgi:hypothetical protein